MRQRIGFVLLVLGIGVFFFYGYDWWQQRKAIQDMNRDQLNEYLGYNQTYIENRELMSDKNSYSFQKGEEIGELIIPSIKKKYQIFWGTDDSTLKLGVGMHDSQWTVTPNQSGHVLLAGHRDTVFEKMGELKIGDVISVNFKGKTYDYQIRKIFVTDKDDRNVVVEKKHPLLTISTCYPFQFIGDAPYRYIVQSEMINVK